jgi:hypothetical protein
MATLDELEKRWEAFFAAVEANQGALTPELEREHDVLQLNTRDKVDGYVARLKQLEALARARRETEQAVERRRKSIERDIEWLRARVRFFMESQGLTALPGEQFTGFKIVPAGGMTGTEVVVRDASRWPAYYWAPPTLDEAKIRETLKGAERILTMDDAGEPLLLAQRKSRGTVLKCIE